MAKTNEGNEFRERWESHIKDFDRLKATVPKSDWGKIEEAQEILRGLVSDVAYVIDYEESTGFNVTGDEE